MCVSGAMVATPKPNCAAGAYGANIGWIDFEGCGDPRINLTTGRLGGFAWGSNVS